MIGVGDHRQLRGMTNTTVLVFFVYKYTCRELLAVPG